MNKEKFEELKLRADKVKLQQDELHSEIMNSEFFTQEDKEGFAKLKKQFEEASMERTIKREENKHRKIIGYDPETFEPIYE